jgi:hypothetical protein
MTPSGAAGLVVVTAAALAVAVPVAASRGGLRAQAFAGGTLLLAGAVAAAPGAGAGGAVLAVLPLAGFAVLLAGTVRALRAVRCPPAAAAGLAALLGCGLLVLPFVGDPLVEARGPGKWSPAAVSILVGGSPLCASVGGGLGIDLLKTPRAYGASGGGLSRIGPYYAHSYPGPAAAGAGLAAAGLLLFAASAGLARRRSAP